MNGLPSPLTLPSAEEIEATAMLLGEQTMICSCCRGAQTTKGIFGGRRRCGQCNGWGYDYIGPKTAEAFGVNELRDQWGRVRAR